MRFLRRLSAWPRERAWFAGILLLALALRVWDLGARSLWFDEATEYWVATAPLSGLADAVRTGSGDPPLFSFLLHFWMKLGTSEAWLRLLSVAASVTGVAGLFVLGRRLGGLPTAIAAGVLAAVNTPDIRYAQDLGQYALMLATVSWSWVALHGLWNEGGRKWTVAWSIIACLATTAYYAAACTVLVPFGCALAEALVRRDRARVRPLAAALGLYLVLTAPVIWSILPAQLSRVLDTRAIVAESVQQRPEGIAMVWAWLGNLFAFHFSGWPYSHVPAWIPIAGWFVLLPFALRAQSRWSLWFVAAWAVYGIAGLLELFPFGFRWGLILLPPVILLAAVGATAAVRVRVLKLVAALAWVALFVSSVVSLPNLTFRNAIDPTEAMPWPETEEMRPVVDYWHQQWMRSQPTYVFYGAAPVFAYYAQRYPDTRTTLPPTWSLECWHQAEPPDYCRRGNIYYGRWLRSMPTAERKIASLAETLGTQPPEIWLVFSHVHGTESVDIIQRLRANGYELVEFAEWRAAGACLMRLQ